MTPGAQLAAAIEILTEAESNPNKPVDQTVASYLKKRRYIGSKDRRQISAMVYGVLTDKLLLDWHLQQVGAVPCPRSLVLAYAVGVQEKSLENLQADFASHYAPPSLDENELAWLAKIKKKAVPVSVQCACPDDLWPSFQKRFGSTAVVELGALKGHSPTVLRVNTLKTDVDAAIARLKKQSIAATKARYAPQAICLDKRYPLTHTDVYKKGWFEIQDEGSQLLALASGVKPGDKVLDMCAGAGGKALALAAMMRNQGHITLTDVNEKRLLVSDERLQRAGIKIADLQVVQDENDAWYTTQAERYDVVIVDAPCSGTGTWRRAPDARYRYSYGDIQAFQALQLKILNTAANMVKPGGHIAYMTCSLLAEENEAVADAFLGKHSDFQLLPIDTFSDWVNDLPQTSATTEFQLVLTPAVHDTDGFGLCLLQKQI